MIRIKAYIDAATVACGVSVSFTRLAIWRVTILHLASIIPTVKVLKYVSSSASCALWSTA